MPNPATDTSPGVPAPPAAPISTLVSAYGKGLQIVVVSVKPSDFLRYKFYKGTSPGSLTFWRESDDSAQYDYDTVYGTTYYYATSQVNTSFLESSQTSAGSGTPVQWAAPDIQHHEITKGWQELITGGITNTGFAGGVYVQVNAVNDVPTIVNLEDVLMIWSGELEISNNYSDVQAIAVGVRVYRDATFLHQLNFVFIMGPDSSFTLPFSISRGDLDLSVGTYDYTVGVAIVGSVSGSDAVVVVRNRQLTVFNQRV